MSSPRVISCSLLGSSSQKASRQVISRKVSSKRSIGQQEIEGGSQGLRSSNGGRFVCRAKRSGKLFVGRVSRAKHNRCSCIVKQSHLVRFLLRSRVIHLIG